MTDSQRRKAEALRRRQGIRNVTYVRGFIDDAPFEDGSFDTIINNGVVNRRWTSRRCSAKGARAAGPAADW